ncbi:hypothetical protein [Neobacillus sp. FSL H8-0543]|uniref:hypothetical protein n=1 Tax=Neobacillus sp. FSL H8-0543 TaxID=2954672 RepID=UPI003158E2F5
MMNKEIDNPYQINKIISGTVKFIREDRFFMGFFVDGKLKSGYVPQTEMTCSLSDINEGQILEVKIIDIFDEQRENGLILSMILDDESLKKRKGRLEKLKVKDSKNELWLAEKRERAGIVLRYNEGELVQGKVLKTFDKEAPRARWIKYRTIMVRLENPRTGEFLDVQPHERELLAMHFKRGQIFTFKVKRVIPTIGCVEVSMILEDETLEEERKRLSYFGLVPESDITYIDSPPRQDPELDRMIEAQIREDAWEYNENH